MFDMLAVVLNVFITFEFNTLSANPIKWLNTLNSSAIAEKLFECVYIIYIILYIYIYYIYIYIHILTLSSFCINVKFILIIQGDIYIYILSIYIIHIYYIYIYIIYIYTVLSEAMKWKIQYLLKLKTHGDSNESLTDTKIFHNIS